MALVILQPFDFPKVARPPEACSQLGDVFGIRQDVSGTNDCIQGIVLSPLRSVSTLISAKSNALAAYNAGKELGEKLLASNFAFAPVPMAA